MANVFRPFSWFRSTDRVQPAENTRTKDSLSPGSSMSPAHATPLAREAVADATDGSRTATAVQADDEMELSVRERIEERAYFKWQADGCPAGRDRDYWLDAETEILNELQRG